jgi:hypothetical protein
MIVVYCSCQCLGDKGTETSPLWLQTRLFDRGPKENLVFASKEEKVFRGIENKGDLKSKGY